MLQATSVKTIIRENQLFNELTKLEKDELPCAINKIEFTNNKNFLPQKVAKDAIIMVCSGKMEVKYFDSQKETERTEQLQAGDVWVGFKALENNTKGVNLEKISNRSNIMVLRLSDLYYQPRFHNIYKKLAKNSLPHIKNQEPPMYENIKSMYSQRLRERTLDMQHFMLVLVCILTMYILSMNYLAGLHQSSAGHYLRITIGVMSVCAALFWWLLRNSHFSKPALGLTFTNTVASVKTGLAGTIVLMGLLVVGKWLIVTFVPGKEHIPVFDIAHVIANLDGSTYWYVFNILGYMLLSAPLQELVFRSGMQGFLQQLFSGNKTQWQPIILTNLLFASSHTIISPYHVLIVFLPGLFWGWLFARYQNLIGVCVSHALFGAFAMSVVDFSAVINR